MPDLRMATARHDALRAELLGRWPELRDDPEATEDTLEGLSDLPDMLAAVVRSALADEDTVDALQARIKKMQERVARIELRAFRKRNTALHFMQEARIPRLTPADFTASLGMGKGRVIVTDEASLPKEYVRTRREPDKKKIGEALRAGDEISGAALSNPEAWLSVRQ